MKGSGGSSQGAGPHFTFRNGRIALALPAELDKEGNHLPRLRALLPALREAIDDLIQSLITGNVPHDHLLTVAKRYEVQIKQELEDISFPQLFAAGLRLENTAEILSRAPQKGEDSLPALSVSQREALEGVLQLHGPFILASAEGQQLVEASLSYQRRPRDERIFRKAAVEFGVALQNRPDIIEPEAATLIRESAGDVGRGRQPERNAILGIFTMRNVMIVLVSGALLNLGSSGILAGALGFVTLEGIKRSKTFGHIANYVIDAIEGGGTTAPEVSEAAIRFRKFLLQNRDNIKRIAGSNKEFLWLRRNLNSIWRKIVK